jgi:hypothetical protein
VAAKTVDLEALALQALAGAIADPRPKVMFGTAKSPGFFKGSTQAVKAAAKLCEDRQWLAATGDSLGKGASRKALYRLTPAGLQALLIQSDALLLLRSVDAALQEQMQLFRSLTQQLGLLSGQLQPLAQVVERAAQRLQPPDISKALASMRSETRSAGTAADGWLDAVVTLVAEQQQRDRYNPLTLPQLYGALRERQPGLALGQYHEGLRTLRDQGRIRLAPYTRALATIDDARNALFLDGEVMYYVELP